MTRATLSYARLWRKVERLAAWLLLPLMALQFLSGYAILHWRLFGGILSKPTAFKIHSVIQPATVAAIAIHGGAAIRRALRRRGLRSRSIDLVLALIGVVLVAFAVYLQRLE
jgi:hypothetical protein